MFQIQTVFGGAWHANFWSHGIQKQYTQAGNNSRILGIVKLMLLDNYNQNKSKNYKQIELSHVFRWLEMHQKECNRLFCKAICSAKWNFIDKYTNFSSVFYQLSVFQLVTHFK